MNRSVFTESLNCKCTPEMRSQVDRIVDARMNESIGSVLREVIGNGLPNTPLKKHGYMPPRTEYPTRPLPQK